MKKLSWVILLSWAALTFGCTEQCKICDSQGRAGLVVTVVDGSDVVHTFTTGENGCFTFEASECDEWMVVDVALPEILMF